jgi:heat shock protein HtpX
LKKIANDKYDDMPKTGAAYAHMYLEDHSSIFATHPPIEKRIAAIEGRTYFTEETNLENEIKRK